MGKDQPGAFFAFTSNVDAHHFDVFAPSEIRECHGSIESYQCASSCPGVWRAPLNFRFEVNKASMLAPQCHSASFPHHEGHALEDLDDIDAVPRVGNVRGGGRPQMLRHMPGPAPTTEAAGFTRNHPVCPSCGGSARPAILMFGDGNWQDNVAQQNRFGYWADAVSKEIAERTESSQPVKAVILEIGAGKNVTRVRRTSERALLEWHDAGADVWLIRINPDLPLGDDDKLKPEGALGKHVISIMERGLAGLEMIDAAMVKAAPDSRHAQNEVKSLRNVRGQKLPESSFWSCFNLPLRR